MKHKKLLFVFLLMFTFFTLVSCNNKSYVGTYKFQLGKDKGTHFSISLVLTDEAVVKDGVEKGKKFSFNVSSKTDSSTKLASYNDPEPTTTLEPTTTTSTATTTTEPDFDELERELLSDISVSGFYTIESSLTEKGNQRLHIGVTSLKTKIFEDEDFDLSETPIDPEIIEKIILIEIGGNTATIKIPVSGDDLLYQLYWYGFDVNLDTFDPLESTPHPVGTHPTAADIEEINKTFPATHKNQKFRDYYTISMGLTKE